MAGENDRLTELLLGRRNRRPGDLLGVAANRNINTGFEQIRKGLSKYNSSFKNEDEKIDDVMRQINPDDPNDQMRALATIRQISPGRAMALSKMFQDANLRASEIEKNNRVPTNPNRFLNLGNGVVFDTESKTFEKNPNVEQPDLRTEMFDREDFTNESYNEFLRESATNKTDEEQVLNFAEKFLMRRYEGGKEVDEPLYYVDENGKLTDQPVLNDDENITKVRMPAPGAERKRVKDLIDRGNRATKNRIRTSNNNINYLSQLLNDLAVKDKNGEYKVKTGTFKSKIFEKIPGTNENKFALKKGIALANLANDALSQARSLSTDGSSGFGQLTERELDLLGKLEGNLDLGFDREELVTQLNNIINVFKYHAEEAAGKQDMNLYTYLGYPSQQEFE